MTWEEFKKRVEAAGVHPTDEIDYIDVSDTSLDSHEWTGYRFLMCAWSSTTIEGSFR